MKKLIILLGLLILSGNICAFAQDENIDKTPSKFKTTVNRIKVKHYAKKFVKAKVSKENEKAGDALQKVFEYGGSDTNIHLYKPCPCRKHLVINGKTVNAEGRYCVTFEYKYNEKDYETGKCKKVKK